MKYKITLLLLIVTTNLMFCQIPEKESIFQGYYIGHKAFEAIQTLNHTLIKVYFKDTTNLSFITQGVESKRFHENNIKINKDVMYNQKTGNYEFIVYAGKHIPTGDAWGLYDYYFVIQMEIDLRKERPEDQILHTTIIKDKDTNDLKLWWRSYMKSYEDPKYAKNEIAEKYGLIPPPPPPPETKGWF